MNALIFVVLVLLGVVVLSIFLLVVVSLLAKRRWQFTTIKEATTVFKNVGGRLGDIWPNISGYKLTAERDPDGNQWLVREKDEQKRRDAFFRNVWWGMRVFHEFLWRMIGVRLVSFLYPQNRVHEFNIRSRLRLTDAPHLPLPPPPGSDAELEQNIIGPATSDDELKNRIVRSPESPVVSELLRVVPRPILFKGLELGGENARINMLVLPQFHQIIPKIPVYDYQGDFFPYLDAAVEAVMVDFLGTHRVGVCRDEDGSETFVTSEFIPENDPESDPNDNLWKENRRRGEPIKRPTGYRSAPLTYAYWTKLDKGDTSPLHRYIRKRVNASEAYVQKILDEKGLGEKSEIYQELLRLAPERVDEIGGELAKQTPHGIIARLGFALVSFRLVSWRAHESTLPLAQALLQKEIEYHKAEGYREKKKGEADGVRYVAEAEEQRLRSLATGLVGGGVPKSEVAGVVDTYLRTSNIRDSKLTTYVEGGASASVMIPAGQPASPEPATEETTPQ